MSWSIVPQEESRGKMKFLVDCKEIRWRPYETPVGTNFAPLGHLLLQVIIRHDVDGSTLKLKLSGSSSINDPDWIVEDAEEKEVYQTITVGQGKSRRQRVDTLSPKVKKKGDSTRYGLTSQFVDRLKPMLGEEMTERILSLFAAKLAVVLNRKK